MVLGTANALVVDMFDAIKVDNAKYAAFAAKMGNIEVVEAGDVWRRENGVVTALSESNNAATIAPKRGR